MTYDQCFINDVDARVSQTIDWQSTCRVQAGSEYHSLSLSLSLSLSPARNTGVHIRTYARYCKSADIYILLRAEMRYAGLTKLMQIMHGTTDSLLLGYTPYIGATRLNSIENTLLMFSQYRARKCAGVRTCPRFILFPLLF